MGFTKTEFVAKTQFLCMKPPESKKLKNKQLIKRFQT